MNHAAALEADMARPGDPAERQRNPHQTFLLLLSVAASLSLVRGRAASALLERELDNTTITAWGISLLIGSTLALVGQFWRGTLWTGLVLERAGLGMVGGAAAIYAGVVYRSVTEPVDVGYVLGVQLAYAAACVWRCAQITKRMRWLQTTLQGGRGGLLHRLLRFLR